MAEEKKLVCIVCPVGCSLKVRLEDGRVISVEGNRCKRGPGYAEKEIQSPVRTVCSTVRVKRGFFPVCPVKTDKEIPKELILECMKQINGVTVTAPVKAGQVLIDNILNTGSSIIATRDMPEAAS